MKKTKQSGIGTKELEGVSFSGEADTEPQLPEDLQEGATGHNREISVLNLTEELGLKVIAAATAGNVVSRRES